MTSKPSLKTFISTLYKDLTSLMSGSLSVIFAVVALYVPSNHAKLAFCIFAGVCVLTCTYKTWANERVGRLQAEEYLTGPDFHIQLHRCYRWTGGGGPFLLLDLTVTNRSTGLATAEHFDCFLKAGDAIRSKDGGWTTVDPFNSFRVADVSTGVLSIQNRATLDLAEAMTVSQLARAHHLHGFIEFYFAKLPSEERGVLLELAITDSLGTKHTAKNFVPFVSESWFGAQISQEYKTPNTRA